MCIVTVKCKCENSLNSDHLNLSLYCHFMQCTLCSFKGELNECCGGRNAWISVCCCESGIYTQNKHLKIDTPALLFIYVWPSIHDVFDETHWFIGEGCLQRNISVWLHKEPYRNCSICNWPSCIFHFCVCKHWMKFWVFGDKIACINSCFEQVISICNRTTVTLCLSLRLCVNLIQLLSSLF